jgi:hypothetical protein
MKASNFEVNSALFGIKWAKSVLEAALYLVLDGSLNVGLGRRVLAGGIDKECSRMMRSLVEACKLKTALSCSDFDNKGF